MNDNDEVDKLCFKDHPKSLGEVRSDRSQKASDWTPRDALIDVLRQIDNGVDVTSLIVSYKTGDNTCFRASISYAGEALALLSRVTWLVNEAI